MSKNVFSLAKAFSVEYKILRLGQEGRHLKSAPLTQVSVSFENTRLGVKDFSEDKHTSLFVRSEKGKKVL
jgi:hypothetical protein